MAFDKNAQESEAPISTEVLKKKKSYLTWRYRMATEKRVEKIVAV